MKFLIVIPLLLIKNFLVCQTVDYCEQNIEIAEIVKYKSLSKIKFGNGTQIVCNGKFLVLTGVTNSDNKQSFEINIFKFDSAKNDFNFHLKLSIYGKYEFYRNSLVINNEYLTVSYTKEKILYKGFFSFVVYKIENDKFNQIYNEDFEKYKSKYFYIRSLVVNNNILAISMATINLGEINNYGNGGLVFIYKLENKKCKIIQEIKSPFKNFLFQFAQQVKIYGNFLLISEDNSTFNNNNLIRLYLFENQKYKYIKSIEVPNEKSDRFFAKCFDIDNNFLIVSSYDDTAKSKIYIFNLKDSLFALNKILTFKSSKEGYKIESISNLYLTSEFLFIDDPYRTIDKITSTGAIYFLRRDQLNCIGMITDNKEELDYDNLFSFTTFISKNYLFVVAPTKNSYGELIVFKLK